MDPAEKARPASPLKQYDEVYYVETSSKNIPINPIAIRPSVQGNIIEWADTSRGTYRHFRHIKLEPESRETPEKIHIQTDKKEEITLTRLTLDVYNRYLRHRVAGSPAFASDEEVKKHYLNTNFDLY